MRVKMLKTEPVRISKRETKNYVVDWEGEVDDEIGVKWIASGSAVRLADEAKPAVLTDQETRVLKAAAQQALAAAQAGETVDPETGEVLDEDDADSDDGEQTDAEVLASMTAAELKALAKQLGVKTTARKRADIEADILAARAAAAATDSDVPA
jgi:hypothetical protein